MQYLGKLAIWIVLAAFFHMSRAKSEVMISPNNLTMLEGSNDTVRCTYNGNNTIQGAKFTIASSVVALIFLPHCANAIPLENYRTNCEGNGIFTLTMTNISTHDHGKQVTCTIFLMDGREKSANDALLNVNIPVKGVSITSPTIKDRVLSECETGNISLQCKTSATRPAANIRWVYQSKFSTGDITTVPNSSHTSVKVVGDMFITSSTLYIIANRTMNSWHIFCSSSNYPDIVVYSSNITFDISYPPTVDPINNQTVTEGSDFNLSCPVNPGNPNATNIIWISIDRTIQGATQFLSFKNISRSHASIYTCTAFNMMSPTNNIKVEGNDSESFHLIVEYRATIKHFFINGYNSDSNVTLNEHDNITFHCNVDSVPTSTTNIKFQNGIILKSTNSTNNVSYSLGPATCLDAGIYECSGRNKYNTMKEDAKEQLILSVKCSPRPHPKMKVKSIITTALNVPLVLSFAAIAYPLPTTVNWQKFNGSNWTIILSYNDTSIQQSDLTFNLTFPNVKLKDLGQFRLVIINDIDEFEHTFNIIPPDRDVYKENQGGSTMGIVIGVVFGIVGTILAVVLVICFFSKRLLCRSQSDRKDVVYQNDIDVIPDNSLNTNEYEQIRMHQQITLQMDTGKHSPDTDDRHDTERNYDSLDKSKRDNNEYSQLSRYN